LCVREGSGFEAMVYEICEHRGEWCSGFSADDPCVESTLFYKFRQVFVSYDLGVEECEFVLRSVHIVSFCC
jgi:hypothetical protein